VSGPVFMSLACRKVAESGRMVKLQLIIPNGWLSAPVTIESAYPVPDPAQVLWFPYCRRPDAEPFRFPLRQ
jgi:hypothetical protein